MSTSRSSIPESEGSGGPSPCATQTATSSSARTTDCSSPRPSGPASTPAVELANPRFALESISRTFHGRDLFAPAAAHLANGVELEELGPPLHPDALVRLDLPAPVVRPGDREIAATMLYVDSFGNIALNLTREHLEAVGAVPGTRIELDLSGERYFAVATRTFVDARPGDVILYEDSYRNMSLAINRGSAAAMLHATPGRELIVRVLDVSALL